MLSAATVPLAAAATTLVRPVAALITQVAPHRCASRKDLRSGLRTEPTFCASTVPFLNRIRVGMLRMPNLGGVCGLDSMSILATRSLSLYSVAISSRIGAIILQGPHHSAQKSSRTGLSDFSTSWLNVASVVCTMSGLLTWKNLHREGSKRKVWAWECFWIRVGVKLRRFALQAEAVLRRRSNG